MTTSWNRTVGRRSQHLTPLTDTYAVEGLIDDLCEHAIADATIVSPSGVSRRHVAAPGFYRNVHRDSLSVRCARSRQRTQPCAAAAAAASARTTAAQIDRGVAAVSRRRPARPPAHRAGLADQGGPSFPRSRLPLSAHEERRCREDN
eukprot:scaffold7335_cov417-Prasinococcus_capsulatus_cf.AAC.13